MARFEELETFVAVVESGSFAAAAERLRLAKSAVSRRVADLESRLGAQLFIRTTRRRSLTDAGRQLYERSVRLLADLEEAEHSVTSGQGELRGNIHLAAPLSFGLLHLSAALADFLRQHPDVNLDLNLDDRQVNIVEEGFDLALRIGRLEDSSLVARRLAPIRMVACASPAYLREHGEPKRPEELLQHAGLFYGYVSDQQNWPYPSAGRALGARVPMRLRSNNGDVLLQAAIHGFGIAVLPTFLAYRALADGRLTAILRDHPLPELALHAVYPSRRHLPSRVRSLVEFLAGRIGDAPYWDRELPLPAAGSGTE